MYLEDNLPFTWQIIHKCMILCNFLEMHISYLEKKNTNLPSGKYANNTPTPDYCRQL